MDGISGGSLHSRSELGELLVIRVADSGPGRKLVGKVLPYLFLTVGPAADPGVQAVSPQVTKPGGRLPLISTRWPAVTSVAFHQVAPHGSTHPIPALLYSFIDSERMKG